MANPMGHSTTDTTRGALLSGLRRSDRTWRIGVMLGPNVRQLGKRDKRLFGEIGSFDELQNLVCTFSESLGVSAEVFASDSEGELLAHVYASAAATDAYIVDPGGLSTISQG